MGEVRKRKTSGEKNGANGAAEAAPVVQKRYAYLIQILKIKNTLFIPPKVLIERKLK